MKHPKIGFIGAGNIGGTAALLACHRQLGSLVLFDINEGLAKGKALDIAQSLPIDAVDASIMGTADPKDLAGCDAVIITAGSPRKPGMSRDDLVEINTKVMRSCAEIVSTHCPQAFCVVVTNPLDAMVWAFQHASQLPSTHVVGMAGILDTARYRHFLGTATGIAASQIQALVLGGHGDSMVPIPSATRIAGFPLDWHYTQGTLTPAQHDAIVDRTRKGGGEIVGLLQHGSAYHAPAAAALQMTQSYLHDQNLCVPCAAHCEQLFDEKNIYAGVPVTIGKNGISTAHLPNLAEEEETAFLNSIREVRKLIESARSFL